MTTQITEITLLGGGQLHVTGDIKDVETAILGAARGSLMALAWVTDAATGQRIGVNPEHVMLLRPVEEE